MMFGCDETCRYADAWVDGELDPGASLLVETHVGQCGACRAEVDMLRSLKSTLCGLREADRAPTQLRARLTAALDAEDRVHTDGALVARKRKHATGFVLAGAALAGFVLVTGRNTTTMPVDMHVASASILPPVLEDIASRHARDLPVEVSGNRPEQVVNFFRGRLGFPVRPVAFRGIPAQLVGARISDVRDRMAAALFYEVDGRRVTVFVFDGALIPKQDGSLFRTMVNNQPIYVGHAHGYTVAISEHDGVGYAVATDLPQRDAIRFVSQAEVQ